MEFHRVRREMFLMVQNIQVKDKEDINKALKTVGGKPQTNLMESDLQIATLEDIRTCRRIFQEDSLQQAT